MADPRRLQVAACHCLPQRLRHVHQNEPPHRSELPPLRRQPLRTEPTLLQTANVRLHRSRSVANLAPILSLIPRIGSHCTITGQFKIHGPKGRPGSSPGGATKAESLRNLGRVQEGSGVGCCPNRCPNGGRAGAWGRRRAGGAPQGAGGGQGCVNAARGTSCRDGGRHAAGTWRGRPGGRTGVPRGDRSASGLPTLTSHCLHHPLGVAAATCSRSSPQRPSRAPPPGPHPGDGWLRAAARGP